MKYPLISIIIPTLNEEYNLPRVLASLKKVDYPKKSLELLIVDGGSTDKTIEIAKKFGARILNNPKKIRGAGCQIGVEKAKGEYIAFTDADCLVPKNWLKDLLIVFKDLKIACVGGPNITPQDDTNFAKAAGEVMTILTKPGSRYGFSGKKVVETYHNPGCNALYRKELIINVGNFNPQLLTCEDEELDFRLLQRGYKILFTPKVIVDHYRRPTYKKLYVQAYRYAIGRAQAIKIHPKMARWFHFAPSLVLLSIMGNLPLMVLFWLISTFLSFTKKQAPFYVYLRVFLYWYFGWAIGFISGFLFKNIKDSEPDKDIKVSEIWNNYWKNYQGVTAFGHWSQCKTLEKVFSLLKEEKISKQSKILDIGCGEGRTMSEFIKKGYKNIIGIDNSQESLAICQKNGLKKDKDIFLIDAKNTLFKNGQFDLVFSEGLLEHFKNPLPIIQEISRVTNNYLLLAQPNHYSLFGKAIAILGLVLRHNVQEHSYPKSYFLKEFGNLGLVLKAEKTSPLKEFFILLFEKKD